VILFILVARALRSKDKTLSISERLQPRFQESLICSLPIAKELRPVSDRSLQAGREDEKTKRGWSYLTVLSCSNVYHALYKVIITFKFVDEILVCVFQIKATVHHNGNVLRCCTIRPLPFGYICG